MESSESLIRTNFAMGCTRVPPPPTTTYDMLNNRHGVTLNLRHMKRIISQLNLGRRSDYTNLDEVVQFVKKEMTHCSMLHWYRWMYRKCIESGLIVRREDVRVIMLSIDPSFCSVSPIKKTAPTRVLCNWSQLHMACRLLRQIETLWYLHKWLY